MKEQQRRPDGRSGYSRRDFLEMLFAPGRSGSILRVKTEKPYICIGIDDAWFLEQVESFLEIAAKHETKFTLFPVGVMLLEDPELWQRVIEAGHEIGNHTHKHTFASGKGVTSEVMRRAFRAFEADYREVFGKDYPFPDPKIARVPFAEGIRPWVQRVLYEEGYKNVHWGWDDDSYSWRRGGDDKGKGNIKYALENISHLEQGDIGVMHFNPLDMAILDDLLTYYKEEKGLINVPFTTLWAARDKKYYGG